MSIRTLEELSDLLARELAWRKKELAVMKGFIENRKFQADQHRVLIRSGVTMLYAHWEGFIKVAASGYLEFVRDDVYDMKSFPATSIFQEILCVIGLSYSDYESKRVLIDEKLLAQRNAIAHGEYLIIDRDEYVELHSQVIEMMNLFCNQIENHAVTRKYRR